VAYLLYWQRCAARTTADRRSHLHVPRVGPFRSAFGRCHRHLPMRTIDRSPELEDRVPFVQGMACFDRFGGAPKHGPLPARLSPSVGVYWTPRYSIDRPVAFRIRSDPQILVALPAAASPASMPGMSTKSREMIYGSRISGGQDQGRGRGASALSRPPVRPIAMRPKHCRSGWKAMGDRLSRPQPLGSA
jgi:hypothetical protein